MPSSDHPKAQLLQQLQPVFVQRGYDGATLAHLAAATGLSKATLYHHFPGGKADMLDQLVRLSISDMQARCFAHLNSRNPPLQRVRNFIKGFVDYTQAGKTDCLLAVLSHHQANDDTLATHQESIAQQFQDWHSVLARTFAEHGYKEKRANREARQLLAALYGALVSTRLHNDPKVFATLTSRLMKNYA